MSELPLICTLEGRALRERREDLLPALAVRAEERLETPTGYRYRFRSTDESLEAIARTLRTERKCCRFLRFHLTFEPDLGPVWLEVSGPSGTKDFLASLGCP
jgi:hypothetical protein